MYLTKKKRGLPRAKDGNAARTGFMALALVFGFTAECGGKYHEKIKAEHEKLTKQHEQMIKAHEEIIHTHKEMKGALQKHKGDKAVLQKHQADHKKLRAAHAKIIENHKVSSGTFCDPGVGILSDPPKTSCERISSHGF